MSQYDLMQVCLKGHVITEYAQSQPESRKNHCGKCGAATITNCTNPECCAKIKGRLHIPGFIGGYRLKDDPTPSHCEGCGQPFPWWIEPAAEAAGKEINVDQLRQLISRFPRFARALGERRGGRAPFEFKDEYDVQDALRAMLSTVYDDVRPEEPTPSFAGKSARVDFLLKVEKTVIEVKMTRTGLADAKIGEELLLDLARYAGHPDCKRLVAFVYDPDHYIKNPAAIKNDLEKRTSPELEVVVCIEPK